MTTLPDDSSPPTLLTRPRRRSSISRDELQRTRHARYFEPDVVYHIIFRTSHGLWLLRPDREGRLRSLIAGVLGHARRTFPSIRLHAATFMSNHAHLAISGNVDELAAYVGFVKREISRRWGPVIGWRGLFADGYVATAVITRDAQLRCVKYILDQSVAAGVVEHPDEWPGFHSAHALAHGTPVEGRWFNATAYGRAAEHERRKRNPRVVRPADYLERADATFEPLPTLRDLTPREYRAEMSSLVDEVVGEGCDEANARPVVGVESVYRADLMTRTDLPAPPWFERRRRMVVWDDGRDGEVRAYLHRYWEFQVSFRDAADRWGDGELAVAFPPGSFRPGIPRPVVAARDVAA